MLMGGGSSVVDSGPRWLTRSRKDGRGWWTGKTMEQGHLADTGLRKRERGRSQSGSGSDKIKHSSPHHGGTEGG
ncbi:Os05g0199301 [Oryza sativa Japonica Group]|uniref:Os05g0199301 protein n=1 Tax=Oryza sativa subsp. japonica TaxID=39947 RepID=A0A0P0WJ11_ORYSJ|nr:Os05g0199301 [Oryza sativa Japonica Group]